MRHRCRVRFSLHLKQNLTMSIIKFIQELKAIRAVRCNDRKRAKPDGINFIHSSSTRPLSPAEKRTDPGTGAAQNVLLEKDILYSVHNDTTFLTRLNLDGSEYGKKIYSKKPSHKSLSRDLSRNTRFFFKT